MACTRGPPTSSLDRVPGHFPKSSESLAGLDSVSRYSYPGGHTYSGTMYKHHTPILGPSYVPTDVAKLRPVSLNTSFHRALLYPLVPWCYRAIGKCSQNQRDPMGGFVYLPEEGGRSSTSTTTHARLRFCQSTKDVRIRACGCFFFFLGAWTATGCNAAESLEQNRGSATCASPGRAVLPQSIQRVNQSKHVCGTSCRKHPIDESSGMGIWKSSRRLANFYPCLIPRPSVQRRQQPFNFDSHPKLLAASARAIGQAMPALVLVSVSHQRS